MQREYIDTTRVYRQILLIDKRGEVVARADPEALERRVTPSAVVVAKVAELRAGHDHEVTDDLGVEFAADLPLVVLDPLVTVCRAPVVVVDVLVA